MTNSFMAGGPTLDLVSWSMQLNKSTGHAELHLDEVTSRLWDSSSEARSIVREDARILTNALLHPVLIVLADGTRMPAVQS